MTDEARVYDSSNSNQILSLYTKWPVYLVGACWHSTLLAFCLFWGPADCSKYAKCASIYYGLYVIHFPWLLTAAICNSEIII